MFTVKKLNYKSILKDVSFQLPQTGFFVITGNNGSGKTTLLKCLLRLLKAQVAQLTYDQFDFLLATPLEIKRHMAYVPVLPMLHFSYTVQEMIHMGQYGLAMQPTSFVSIYERCDLIGLENREVTTLSSGERQRVYLARAIAMQTPILLLDEVTSFLDWQQKIKFISLIQELKQKTLIMAASHDFGLTKRADAILHLDQGALHFEAEPGSFLRKFYPLLHD